LIQPFVTPDVPYHKNVEDRIAKEFHAEFR
jgi:hypothetical protein